MESLPFNDEPEIFGMHENANIAFQVRHESYPHVDQHVYVCVHNNTIVSTHYQDHNFFIAFRS